ncbi:molybdenum cofactor guanylyltransferase [Bacteroidota bacterium]
MTNRAQSVQSRSPVALILAGGGSKRFGSNKLVVETGGKTILQHAVEAASGVVPELYLSVGAAGHSILAAASVDLPVVYDEIPDIGPLGGLHAAFSKLDAEWILLVAGDMPRVTAPTLQTIVAARATYLDAVIAKDPDGRVHPLLGCYRSSVQAHVVDQINRKNYSMKGLISRLKRVRYITFPLDVVQNVNRPDDLRATFLK